MVHGSKESAISARGALMLNLQCRRRSAFFARPSQFLSRRLGCTSAGAIEADLVHRHCVDDRLVVGVADDGGIHPCNGGVVEEYPVVPVSPLVASAGITEAVVDAAVVADMRPPISGVPIIAATVIPPITGSPNSGQQPAEEPRCQVPSNNHLPRTPNNLVSICSPGPDTAAARKAEEAAERY